MLASRPVLTLLLLGAVAGDARAAARPDYDAWLSGQAGSAAGPALAAPVHVLARDPSRGVPSLVLVAPGDARSGDPVAIARGHLDRHRGLYGAGRAALRGARHRFTHDNGRGPLIVVFSQSVGGVEVFHGDVKVLLDRAGRLRAIGGSPHPDAHPGSARPFALAADAAIGLALRDLHPELGEAPRLVRTAARAGFDRYDLAVGEALRFRRPARVKQVYYPLGAELVPGWLVEVQVADGADLELYQYVIGADDGRILHRHDATASEAFKYRVWADDGGDLRPLDGPTVDFTPHPTGVPGEGPKTFTAPALVSIDGFNSEGDPWLAADATETKGNNVDAYVDHADPDGLNGNEFRGKITAPGVFDWIYDVKAQPLANQTQSMAAIVTLFYINNWLHDWWYDSGFDEAAGNAQEDNYGRGGKGGDPLHAEAQDGALKGSRNNANMSTPLDGESPRMQMFLWSAISDAWLKVTPLAQTFAVGTASFGPQNFDLSAPLVVINDGQGTTSDGCQPAVNNLVGKIAIVDRGTCSFEIKAKNAQAAGAVGTLIANNADGDTPPGLGSDPNTQDPTIPVLSVTKAAGAALKAALQNIPQNGQMFRAVGVERDGTIDAMIVAHEWGHYIHHRLQDCGSQQCRAQSEGWGDFLSLHTALRDGDDLGGVYPGVTYASLDPTGYYGIRRVPYSVDFTKNSLTFKHIGNGVALPNGIAIKPNGIANSEVHNAGEIWTTMLWESYVALHEAKQGSFKFEDVRRAMADYVVAGMVLAPTSPTYTEQRDALLAAIAAVDTKDFLTVAEAFARRGAGTCAVSPPKESTTLVGVVEDYALGARGVITSAELTESQSCDGDGVIDVGEVGELAVQVWNPGADELAAGATLEIVDPPPALVFPNGSGIKLGALAVQGKVDAVFTVLAADDLVTHVPLTLTVRLTTPAGCDEVSEVILPIVVNGDVLEASSTSDDVETPTTAWSAGGTEAEVWARAAAIDGHHWHGVDVGHKSDTWLQSPVLEVSPDKSLLISFEHAYRFEFSDNTYWDGGVLEISPDAGKTWEDIAKYVDPGYPGTIGSAANPLDKRPAFVNKNAAFPEREPLSLDLGDTFAGQSIRIRFRVGTDAAAGDHGWDIDNLSFEGILNAPFATWIPDQGICQEGTTGDTSGGTDGTSGGTDGTSGGTDGTSGGTDGTSGGESSGSASASASASAGTDGTSGSASATGGSASGGTGGSGGTASTGASDGGTGTDTAGQISDEGCGCRSGAGARGLPWLLAPLLALGRRRRR